MSSEVSRAGGPGLEHQMPGFGLVWRLPGSKPPLCAGFAWCLSPWVTPPQRESTGAEIIIITTILKASINSTVFVVAPATLSKHWSWRKLVGFTFLGKNVVERIPTPTPHLFHRPFSLLPQPLKWRERIKKQDYKLWDQHYAILLLGLLSTLFRNHCWGLPESELEFVCEKRQGNVIDPHLILFLLSCWGVPWRSLALYMECPVPWAVWGRNKCTLVGLCSTSATAFQLRISWSHQTRETRTNNGFACETKK